jgi:apolipoprotein N-acyltransferase
VIRGLPTGARAHLLARLALCVLAGLALLATFPPLSWWPLGPLGAGALVIACVGVSAGRGAVLGAVAGLSLFVPLLSWLGVVGIDAWLLLAVSQAAFLALLGAALATASRLPGWPLWTACLWVGEEFLRDRLPFGGFPWGRLAFGQDGGPLVRLAAVGGAPLVTFAVALAGGLLAWAAVRSRRSRRSLRSLRAAPLRRTAAPSIVAALAGAVAVCAVGLATPVPTAGESGAAGAAYTEVAVVQGNVPRLGLREFEQERAVIRYHAAETERLAREIAAGERPRPDIVIWPENSSDLDPFVDAEARSLIDAAVRSVGAPTLVGAVLDGIKPGTVRNSGIVWSPQTGPGAFYVKRHPVPFGEYVPFRGVLTRLVGRFALVPFDFAAGHEPGVLELGKVRIGDVICFEVAYDGIVRDVVDGGARLLTVQTNNATFERRGDTGQGGETAQQLGISRLRAIEHGRAVLVAATSGVSAVIMPDGRVVQRSGVYTSDVLSARVPLRDTMTIADRVGAVPEWLLTLVGAAALGAAVVRRRRRSLTASAGGPEVPAQTDPADHLTAGRRP